MVQLGVPTAHWHQIEVSTKLDKGEWVLFDVNVCEDSHHFVLLKPALKAGRHRASKVRIHRRRHKACKAEANGLCVFTAALHIVQGAGKIVDSGVGKLARAEFAMLKDAKDVNTQRVFSTLMQVASLYEHMAAHLCKEGTLSEGQEWLKEYKAVCTSQQAAGTAEEVGALLRKETAFHIRMYDSIKKQYSKHAACSGTWLPQWAAAFGETVHM